MGWAAGGTVSHTKCSTALTLTQLRAMSEIHLTPVMVYQADAPPLCIGNSDGHPSERMLLVS